MAVTELADPRRALALGSSFPVVSYQRRGISSNERPAFPPHSIPDNGSDQPPLVSELSRGDLKALTERVLAENAELRQAVAELRAEIAKLKGVTGRPTIRPSGMEQK